MYLRLYHNNTPKSLSVIINECREGLFRIVGMYCFSYKSIVEKQLKNEDGTKKIDIDYMKERVVEFDPMLITKEQIKKKL
jgi:copper chaperone CopZ